MGTRQLAFSVSASASPKTVKIIVETINGKVGVASLGGLVMAINILEFSLAKIIFVSLKC